MADDHERTHLRRSLWPANDLWGPYGFKDERMDRPRKADGTPIPEHAEAQPISEKQYPVRARCVLRTDGTLHQCYVMARSVEAAEALGRAIPSKRLQPAYAHGHVVSTAYSFTATITLTSGQ